MSSSATTSHPPEPARSANLSRWLGIVALLPAAVAWICNLVIPAFRTIELSLTGWDPEQQRELPRPFVGLANYAALPKQWYLDAAFHAIVSLLLGITFVALGLMVGTVLRRSSGWVRIVSMALLGLCALGYAPMNRMLGFYASGPLGKAVAGIRLGALLPLMLLIFLLAAVGAFVATRMSVRVVLACVLVCAAIAGSLTQGVGILAGPTTPMSFIYQLSPAEVGFAAGAAASTLIGIVVGILGSLATVLLALAHVRWRGRRRDGQPGQQSEPDRRALKSRDFSVIIAAVAALAFAIVISLPWLRSYRPIAADLQAEAGEAMRSTLAVYGLDVLATVVVTGLAAFSLGYLRPFGRASRWLLLAGGPWLFATFSLVGLGVFYGGQAAPGDGFFSVHNRLVNVPLLFLFTWIADGARRRRTNGSPRSGLELGALSVLGVATLALVRYQSPIWEVMSVPFATTNLRALQAAQARYFEQFFNLNYIAPPWLLAAGAVVFVAAGATLAAAARRRPRSTMDA